MWDLNDSPDRRRDDEESEEGCCSSPIEADDMDKGKRVGSVSNSSSSAVVIEDGYSEEEADEELRGRNNINIIINNNKKRGITGNKLFGFPVMSSSHHHHHHNDFDNYSDTTEPPPPPAAAASVTRQFFPLDDSELGGSNDGCSGPNFPRAHWVGVKFCQSSESNVVGKSSAAAADISQPLKKSRRGPRSRSSQYRGVTFYRRTGRWESHIWSAIYSFLFLFIHLDMIRTHHF